MNDLRALLALGLGLTRHGALHVGRQIHMFDFNRRHLDPPWVGVLVEDLLQLLIQPLALREQIVEVDLSQHAAQRGLGELRRGILKVFDDDNGLVRFHHAEIHDGTDLDRHVVARNHILRRHVEDHRPEADAHDPIDWREHEDDAGPFRGDEQFTEPEDHAALVFRQDLDRAD